MEGCIASQCRNFCQQVQHILRQREHNISSNNDLDAVIRTTLCLSDTETIDAGLRLFVRITGRNSVRSVAAVL